MSDKGGDQNLSEKPGKRLNEQTTAAGTESIPNNVHGQQEYLKMKPWQANQYPTSREGADEKAYVPGYTYTRQEADKYFKELCGKDNWDNSEIEFMRAYNKVREGTTAQTASGSSGESTGRADAQPVRDDRRSSTENDASAGRLLKVGERQIKFELGGEADLVGWRRWQEAFNREVYRKLEQLATSTKIPAGSHVDMNYTVYRDGRFSYNLTGNNLQYNTMVKRAVDDTLRYHPELKRFPERAKEMTWSRSVTFNAGGPSGYQTGDVQDDVEKR